MYQSGSIPHFQKGFCHALDGLTDLGLLDDKPLPCLEVGAPPLKWVSDIITCVFSGYDIHVFNCQKELVATLVSSPTDAADLRSIVYNILGKDDEKMKAVDG